MREKRVLLTTAKQRLEELETLLCRIYEDHLLGRLPDARYATLDEQYGKEQDALKAEIAAMKQAIRTEDMANGVYVMAYDLSKLEPQVAEIRESS